MTPSSISFDSLLAIDIGETRTRAILFDIVDGSYRFIAAGSAATTIGSPIGNVSEGARLALDNLSEITGRRLIGKDERLLVPTTGDGAGVDALVVVMSGGNPLKVVIAGLLEDVSVDSARRLASTTYAEIVDIFSLNDRRKTAERVDALLKLRPNLVLVSGGTDGGAGQSIGRLLEPIRLACNLLPQEIRPELLYAGNQELGERVEAVFAGLTKVHLAPNVRPTLEDEQLETTQAHLARMYRSIKLQEVVGLQELDTWAGGGLMPRATAFSRVIRFLSLDDDTKGVLGVDLGAGSLTMAAARSGNINLGVYPEYGLTRCTDLALNRGFLTRLQEWLPDPIPEDYIQDYIANKAINPSALPLTKEDLLIEQALGRMLIRIAASRIGSMLKSENADYAYQASGLLPPMEPIIAAGNALTEAPSRGQSMSILLDSLQPVGITTIFLDHNNLSAALGAAASVNATLSVQVLDSGTFTSLGTVICPISGAKPGTPVLRVQMTMPDTGEEIKLDVKQGSLEVLPLAPGQSASLYLKPFHRADIGMGPGKGGNLNRVLGGSLGVVIDARGRPLRLSKDTARRQELLRKWAWTLGN